MVSYAHPDQVDIIAEACQSFALDNGAFSVWRSGKTLDVEGYADWCEEWSKHPGFAWCLIPDVIEGTDKDNDDMIARWMTGLKTHRIASVPVWHFHESPRRLQALCSRFSLVALGSSGQWSQPGSEAWWERVNEVMPYCTLEGVPYCKLHGLRMLNPEIFTRLPFASADSTNAAQNAGRPLAGLAAAWQRANVIANRIEAHNASARWTPRSEKQLELWTA